MIFLPFLYELFVIKRLLTTFKYLIVLRKIVILV